MKLRMIVPTTMLRRPTVIIFLLFFFAALLTVFRTDVESSVRVVNPFGSSKISEEVAGEKPLLSDNVPDATISRTEFIAASSRVEIPQFNPSAIQTMCSEGPSWSNDLVIECTEGMGGLNNVRQQILSCVRWAIEFKAGLILPKMKPRQQSNGSESVVHQYDGARNFDILFNLERFLERLHDGCPQMTIYDNVTEVAKFDHERVDSIFPPKADVTKEQAQSYKLQWINNHPATDGKIRVAQLRRLVTQYDICSDGEDFANSFGQILTARADAYRLAAAVLYELSRRFHLTGFDAKASINPNAFLGIHLRTSSDAVKEGWMSYEEQALKYQQYASLYALPVIYAASGNLSSTELFTKAVYPTPVVTKSSLLSKEDLSVLRSMTWDQQAEVDYLVLLRASRFLGMTDSNFSWAVAVARRTEGELGSCGGWEEGKEETIPEPGIAFKDELSIIIGGPSKYHFGTWSWP